MHDNVRISEPVEVPCHSLDAIVEVEEMQLSFAAKRTRKELRRVAFVHAYLSDYARAAACGQPRRFCVRARNLTMARQRRRCSAVTKITERVDGGPCPRDAAQEPPHNPDPCSPMRVWRPAANSRSASEISRTVS